ncbi:MAG: helix-turn-helix transcriptional regulator [bacterium]
MDGNVRVAGFRPGATVAPGAALRGLRRRAGLSLVELAHLMGRKPGFYSHLSRLEHGRVGRPTLGLVAHCLRACPRVARRRACGASFGELAPVLDRHAGGRCGRTGSS